MYRSFRRIKDRLARGMITAGGLSIILTILLVLFYLFYETIPLFQRADFEFQPELKNLRSSQVLYVSIEEQNEVGMRLLNTGEVEFFSVIDGSLLSSSQLPLEGASVTAFALESEASRIIALGLSNGKILSFRHD